MKFTCASAVALLGLVLAPVPAFAQEEEPVSYKNAMQCTALYSLLAGSSEGSDTEVLEEMATVWLVVAMARDGTEDGSKAEAELEPTLDELIEMLEQAPDEASGEEFLSEGITFCDEKYEMIAEEIESIEFE